MLRKVFDFIFSAPPAPPETTPSSSAALKAPPKPAPNTETAREVAWWPIFLTVLLPSIGATATASYFLGPFIFTLDKSVLESLTPAPWLYGLSGTLPGIAVAGLIAHGAAIVHAARSGALKNVRWAKPALWILALVMLALPLIKTMNSAVLFTDREMHVGSPYGLRGQTYAYEDVTHVLATIENDTDTHIPQRGNFVFAIRFKDGSQWVSKSYPQNWTSEKTSTVLRFISRKTGKFTEVTDSL